MPIQASFSCYANICLSSVISKNVQKTLVFSSFLKNSLMHGVMKTLQGRALNVNQKCTPDGFKIDQKSFPNRAWKRVRFEVAFPIVPKQILDRIWTDFGFQMGLKIGPKSVLEPIRASPSSSEPLRASQGPSGRFFLILDWIQSKIRKNGPARTQSSFTRAWPRTQSSRMHVDTRAPAHCVRLSVGLLCM